MYIVYRLLIVWKQTIQMNLFYLVLIEHKLITLGEGVILFSVLTKNPIPMPLQLDSPGVNRPGVY